MARAPQITVTHIRQLLNSPASDPILYITDDGSLAVGSESNEGHHPIVATREEAADFFGEDHVDGLDTETIQDLLPETEQWVESALETANG
ncbi:hypothetical protein ACFV1C_00555 [Streptomyces sp. NPDC059605]|uniref:hypothetical protein n=1 Tax=Streptomyces sp. NPDC059605 TaxID=3346882 RepID=UPI0036B5CD5D